MEGTQYYPISDMLNDALFINESRAAVYFVIQRASRAFLGRNRTT
jgi:hypothetical protein